MEQNLLKKFGVNREANLMSNNDKLSNAIQAGKDAITKTLDNNFNVIKTAKELNDKYGDKK